MSNAKILIVEDVILTGLELAANFRQRGYAVCELAGSGEEAVEVAEREQPDVVLMDIKLLDGNTGIAAAQQIHTRFGSRIAFITGYDETPEMREQIEMLKPFGYFLKPLKIEEIQAAIETALQQ